MRDVLRFGKDCFHELISAYAALRFEWKLPEASLFPSLGWNGSWSLFASGGLYDQSRRAFFLRVSVQAVQQAIPWHAISPAKPIAEYR